MSSGEEVDQVYSIAHRSCTKLTESQILILIFNIVYSAKTWTKKLNHRRDDVRCVKGHSRSLKVIRCCANQCSIYDFLLAFNINLTSISTVLEISCLIWTSIPHPSSRWNWKKMAGSRWARFGVRVPRTLDYPIINLNPR